MAMTPDLPGPSIKARPTRAVGALLLAVCAGATLAACTTEEDRTVFPTQTFATASLLTATVTPPSAMDDPHTPVDVATTFLTAYAGGNMQLACQYVTSDFERALGAQCNSTEVLERLPVVTVIDTCPQAPGSNVEYGVRFHLVPGSGRYPLPVRGDQQDLVVWLSGAGSGYEVSEAPTTTDPALPCAEAVALTSPTGTT